MVSRKNSFLKPKQKQLDGDMPTDGEQIAQIPLTSQKFAMRMQGPDQPKQSRSAGVEVLSFLRDSFYNLTYHATSGGSLGLA